jgi:hypothetical protein
MSAASSATAAQAASDREQRNIDHLLRLTLTPQNPADSVRYIKTLTRAERAEFISLANSHHVVVRALQPVLTAATMENDDELRRWAESVLAAEQKRIENALAHLHAICSELEAAGCQTTVIKSLDHWPDLGNDLDLYTTASERQVISVMQGKFNARIEARSWGDRIAQKWNFAIDGLPEAVEVHAQRLGQMGEHTRLAQRFVTRRVQKTVNGLTFNVPAPEERIIVATLQRMYRHFYFRVCDIVNSAALIASGELDFAELQRAATAAGIWAGVASYMKIVSDYVHRYRETPLDLPQSVLDSAIVGGSKVYIHARFLRVPIVPHGASLYTQQVTKTALNGDVPATFRLTMLPYLASAAAVAYKITGSDKGVW